jgi:hypothetical protein
MGTAAEEMRNDTVSQAGLDFAQNPYFLCILFFGST